MAGSGRAATVVVVGAVNVDLVVESDRLPGPGETVVGGPLRTYGGGKGANAAVAAARSGARAVLVGAVGQDGNGDRALAELDAAGVDVRAVARVGEVATGVALIVVSPGGENQIAVSAGANLALPAGHVRRVLSEVLPAAGCLLVSTEIAPDAVIAAVECAAEAGTPCLLNPAPVTPGVLDLLDRAPLLTPNATELDALAAGVGGAARVPAGDRVGTARLVSRRTGRPVVVTLGGEGVLVVDGDRPAERIPAFATEVVDTTGAGDTFNGVLAHGIARGEELSVALRRAVAAASLSVSAVGARSGMPDATAIAGVLSSAPS